MELLDKILALPEQRRKIILWVIMAITAILLFKLYVFSVEKEMKRVELESLKQELQIPQLQQELEALNDLNPLK